MKSLSLTQPWASLVAISAKRIETRSWVTNYRGRIAIHAAKGFPRDAIETCLTEPFKSSLRGHIKMPNDLPRGAVIATATLVDCLRIGRTVGGSVILHGSDPVPVHEPELSFGNYSPGRWGWLLADVVKLPEPVPARGSLGLWEWAES